MLSSSHHNFWNTQYIYYNLKCYTWVICMVIIASLILVKLYQGPENKIFLPNLSHSSGRIIFPMAVQDDIWNFWISFHSNGIPIILRKAHCQKLSYLGSDSTTEFNGAPYSLTQKKSFCPPHKPVHSMNSHLHCLQMWKTITSYYFLNLTIFSLKT